MSASEIFKKKKTKTANLDASMTTVNNFFGHWFKDIEIRRYPDDKNILSTNNSVSIANYSNAQMKYLPLTSLKRIRKTMLYVNTPVYITNDNDRRANNATTDAARTDPNLNLRIKTFADVLSAETVYRIPLLYLCDLGKVNFSVNTDTRITITLQGNLNKLFESNKKVASIPDNSDAFIKFFARPYIAYQETSLTQQAGLYQGGILRSRTALRQGVLPAPFQQEFEVAVGTQNFTCLLQGAQRQIDWIEISIVYDKSYHHETIMTVTMLNSLQRL